MNNIHNTAIISSTVKLGDNITIGPYSVIEGDIEIGDNCIIGPFVHITNKVKIGNNTKIFPYAAIGELPQDYSYDGQIGLVEIGSGCIIREGVTIHMPIKPNEGEKTVLGDNVFLMAYSHVAHNVKIGNNTVMANGTLLAGFVIVEDNVFISGNVAVHQHCRIGGYSIIGALTKITQDVPPFLMVDGNPARAYGLNVVGLRRKGFTQEQRTIIKKAYKILYSGQPYRDAIKTIEENFQDPNVIRIVNFVKSSKRGIISGKPESDNE